MFGTFLEAFASNFGLHIGVPDFRFKFDVPKIKNDSGKPSRPLITTNN